MDQRAEKIISLMNTHLHEIQSPDSLARAVNLSPSRLRHLFKNEVGITPKQYFNSLRMERAKYLLETTFLRVKEVALRVGMSCDSCLVRDFKRTYGIAPAQYRALYRAPLSVGASPAVKIAGFVKK